MALQRRCLSHQSNQTNQQIFQYFVRVYAKCSLSSFESFLSTTLGMNRGSRAIFQFYPENPEQVELLTSAAMRAGFTGGLLVDYPNSAKAKKSVLVLSSGLSSIHFLSRYFL